MKKYAILTKILNALRKFQDLGLSLKEVRFKTKFSLIHIYIYIY